MVEIARIDPIAIETVAVDRVDHLDQPHQRDDPHQQGDALAGFPLDSRRVVTHRQSIAGGESSASQFSASVCNASTSATSARCASDLVSTNSSGVWAPPPRGPRPSIVVGIAPAKWLASLAPPRATPTIGRPRRSPARASSED